ncbi:MAG: pyrroline-5-carboxylate reductase [Phycisphaerales bacterium]|nr:pyrroline-5-carboxylate reductase [Phycisphaerales bacterium]
MSYWLGIIGGGNMGSAILGGCIQSRVLAAHQIIVAEIDAQKRRELAKLGCATTESAVAACAADQIILAVKPQAFPPIAREIGWAVNAKLVISIMAGLSSTTICRTLGSSPRIIRAMPNVACQVNAGMTAIAIGAGAKPGDEKLAVSIFDAIGKTTMVDESMMHAVTAVSGSGPAYVFLLAQAMEQAAVQMGIAPGTARLLVAQTIAGAGQLLAQSNQSAGELRDAVTSPGGTTADALELMFEHDLPQTIVEALLAARDRGMELDKPGT